ncbi:ankyrin repeat domain-containing protein 28 [Fusarium flagelliforme]|uniref:Ankyrin repeat domain-containing protein 28 n=1 Tax=Fusarium flagelliforme TaxID=2675880 RepID=A0A395MMG3_9HYPO|nr:ankyrin repeat domain-containing protein 28 [Fusarium flagelliforme]
MAPISLLLLFLLVPSATALFGASNETDFWDDFANNFATDLAPVIALFGEQVTKQFLSQSTTFLDVIIFSVGPLGIITAVVSCIRVSNVTFLRSAVGRAREPHGIPEVELCTSTSENVCELWSNGGICRVFGRPRILEFIYKRPTDPKAYRAEYDDKGMEVPAKCGIESTIEVFNSEDPGQEQNQWQEASSYGLMFGNRLAGKKTSIKRTKLDKRSEGGPDIEEALSGTTTAHVQRKPSTEYMQSNSSPTHPEDQNTGQPRKGTGQGDGSNNFAPFPNLALNMGVPRSSREFGSLWFAAIIGILLQVSFFVFATWATQYNTGFYEDGKIPSDPSWFVLTLMGTACIVIGMSLCAQVIEGASTKRRFVHAGAGKPIMFWLQPAGQRIGDQEFDGFAYSEAKSEYITSWKATQSTAVTSWRVWLAITLSTLGWVIQFIGLRGVHGSVALYQLAVTLLMSAIRSILRSYHTPPSSQLSSESGRTAGHELDWQARELTNRHYPHSGGSKSEGSRGSEGTTHGTRTGILLSINDERTSGSIVDVRSGLNHYRFHWQSPQNNIFLVDEHNEKIQGLTPKIIEWIESKDLPYWQKATTTEVFQEIDYILEAEIPYHSKPFPQQVVEMVRIRSRLAFLTNQPHYQVWDSDVRDMSRRLKNTLERAVRILAAEALLYPKTQFFDFTDIVWSVGCHLNHDWGCGSLDSGLQQPLCFHMNRIGDIWNIDQHQLEAVLGLWLWAYDERHFQTERLQPGSKSCVASPAAQGTTKLLLLRWGVRPREGTDTVADEAGIISVDSVAPMLQLMAQEILTLFLKRTAFTFEDERLLDTLYPDLDGPQGTRRSFVEDMSQMLVAEGLATHEEAIMSIVPAFYRHSAFQEFGLPLELRLISKANSFKRQTRFDESEEVLHNLMHNEGSGFSRALAQQSFLELCRFQLRHMAKFILAEASASNAPLVNSRRIRSAPDMQKGSLDEETLAKLKLDTLVSVYDTEHIYPLALTLRDQYDLETTDCRIRKALLRWAIVNGCTGLAEDLWDLEQWLDPADSAFSGGSDELLYAVVSPKYEPDTMSMLLFLLEVARVPASGFRESGQMEDARLLSNEDQTLLTAAYKQYTCPLSVAAARNDDMIYVRIMAESTVWSNEYVQDAIRAAVESGNTEIANYLRFKIEP